MPKVLPPSGFARPAHRPSRRVHILDAAVALFATVGFDDVTVGDIAAAAKMTPAAVYYHFASKEQILLEAVRRFGDDVLERARRIAESGEPAEAVVVGLIEHVRRQPAAAKVAYLASSGLNAAVETYRRSMRTDLSEMLALLARRARPAMSDAEAGVIGTALVSLFEVSATSLLGRDLATRQLGSGSIGRAAGEIATTIIG